MRKRNFFFAASNVSLTTPEPVSRPSAIAAGSTRSTVHRVQADVPPVIRNLSGTHTWFQHHWLLSDSSAQLYRFTIDRVTIHEQLGTPTARTDKAWPPATIEGFSGQEEDV